jgi:hypothetical protein
VRSVPDGELALCTLETVECCHERAGSVAPPVQSQQVARHLMGRPIAIHRPAPSDERFVRLALLLPATTTSCLDSSS